jgi:hypothetical protein
VRIDDDVFVIHAVPRDAYSSGGVVLEPLARFTAVENAAEIGAYRIKGVTNDSRARIRDYLLQQIGKPFDDAFLLSDDRRVYCTELVLRALSAGGIHITGMMPRIQVMLLSEPVVPPDYLRRLPIVHPVMLDGKSDGAAGLDSVRASDQRDR